MKILRHLSPAVVFALLPAALFAAATPALAAPPTGVEAALAQLDKASASFQSAQATFKKDIFDKIGNRHTLQDGSLYVERTSGATSMGLTAAGPIGTTAEYTFGTLRQYQPATKCYDAYSNLKKPGVEMFLVVGFGGNSKDLKKTWKILDLGNETIQDGKSEVKVEKLDLTSIDKTLTDRYTHITLWIDLARGISLKQVFYTPAGDTLTAVYSNIRMNQSIEKKNYAVSGNACRKSEEDAPMKILTHLRPIAAFALLPGMAYAAPTPLDTVLAQMDKASTAFKSAQADFTKDIFEKIVSDHTLQKGSLYVERKGGDTYMGVNITGNGATTVEYTPGTVRQYQPGLKCFNTYSSLNKASVESFLTLGFGGSGTELKKTWTITDQGSETLSDGKSQVKVEKLDLVGKDQSVRNNFTHVTLWIDPVRGVSLKQVFYTPSGDTQTAIYSNIRMGGSIDKKPYAISGSACHK